MKEEELEGWESEKRGAGVLMTSQALHVRMNAGKVESTMGYLQVVASHQ